MMAELVTITPATYERFLRNEAKLLALEAAGVNNWEGFEDAMASLEE